MTWLVAAACLVAGFVAGVFAVLVMDGLMPTEDA